MMTNPTLPPLWSHQAAAIKQAKNRYALFFDPGCGKSRTVLEILKRSTSVSKVIIYAPLNVCRNWENEIATYYQRPYHIYLVSGQTKVRKLKIIKEFVEHTDPETAILICNIESLRAVEYRALMCSSGAQFIVCDESHLVKSPTSAQTKGLFDVVRSLNPKQLYLLTGTPAPQGEIDLWTTFVLMGKTRDNFYIWRKKNFIDKNERRRGTRSYWPEYVVSPTARAYMKTLLTECSLTAKKDDVLDLPELLRVALYAEMSPIQARHYETMKEYLFAIDKDGNELNASNMLVRTLRLQQILAGFINDAPIEPNPRIGVLKDAIAMTNGAAGERNASFLIWTIFKATYGQIAQVLDDMNISYGMLTGEQSAEERHAAMCSFQAGELRCLIAHPKAGGVGVNLTAASYSIHHTRSYSLTDDLQAEARNHRGGSEIHKRITRIDIVTPNTIDEEIMVALKSKKTVQEFILGLKQ